MIVMQLLEAASTATGPASADLFKWVVTAVLGGGTITGFLTYKIQRRKVPAEADSIAVQGAEGAVLAMQKVYEAEAAAHQRTREDRDRLAAEATSLRAEVRALLEEIEGLRRRAVTLADRVGVDTDPNGLPTVGPGFTRG